MQKESRDSLLIIMDWIEIKLLLANSAKNIHQSTHVNGQLYDMIQKKNLLLEK
jgi:hypothetical protein